MSKKELNFDDCIKELNEILEDMKKSFIKKQNDLVDTLKKEYKKSINEPCKISFERNKNEEGATVHVEGRFLPILISLAGLEKNILNTLNCNSDMFEIIKDMTDYEIDE